MLDCREHLRIPVRLRLSFSGRKVRGEGTVIDMSLGGCKIKSDTPVVIDDIYYLEIVVSEQEAPIEVPAIVRSVGARGIAFKFLRKARENKRLLSFIRSQTGSIPSLLSRRSVHNRSGCVGREDSCLIGQAGCDDQRVMQEKRYSIK
ncbi:MAG: PilZ domain-containing protein [Nitrospira sp.]|nr:PilZ domain-containing protein [Nitrospira sp.]